MAESKNDRRQALELAIRLTRKCGTVSIVGVYAERVEVHLHGAGEGPERGDPQPVRAHQATRGWG